MMKYITLTILALTANAHVLAETTTINMNLVSQDGVGKNIGYVTVSETDYGLLFTPNLTGVADGVHGFHIHVNPSCDVSINKDNTITPAGAAGGHFDPLQTNKHLGPYNNQGHLGDLPALSVFNNQANYPVLAPRLNKINQIKNHALMVHVGGDNHDDHPVALGGGGARFACGVIK
ncbi:superoxide dismutase [Cu-Zn] SodC [Neisseria sp. Ec49-e6-T10]|uniref:superoxide dismutase [Cu-Zn] SodC n=1 Tax=Neisseria sp. Ec49-e6-T10 TaxID=3140744 RepID=UPI003EBFF1F2